MTELGSETESTVVCSNVWKLYGTINAELNKELLGGTFDSGTLEHRLRESGSIIACCDVSFEVKSGEIFVIMGLSGSGKSTIVRCLSRLVEPNFGEILFDGKDLLSLPEAELTEIRRHKMGMVFQNFGLLPHLSVFENIAFPLKLQGMPVNEQRERAQRVVELVGLQGREDSYPSELSGGQQQRVGIARSLTVEPELWLLDEPFSALDPLIRRQMQDEFLRLQSVLKKSIVFITHDFIEALRIADRMAIMRDGRIIQVGTPEELVANPVDDYVRDFTREVPLMRVLRAGQLIDENATELVAKDDLPSVDESANSEALVRLLAKSPVGVAVTGASGERIGVATPLSLITRLSHELPSERDTQA